ncbi:MAG: hypothetical protein LBH31_03820 [Burkholderiaceae bacterium]|jgi:hypothetical protein|nr:hypothetical protein [Burkholderiaceae bacterium]
MQQALRHRFFALLLLGAPCLSVAAAQAVEFATTASATTPVATASAPAAPDTCIAPITYLPLDPAQVGADSNGAAALGTYERISPDGRFILRSYSGARLGQVSLIELPAQGSGPIRAYRTPFSNEAFPVQRTWRYLVDVNGDHYRFAQVLHEQTHAKPLFRAGMTGFYAVASEMAPDPSQPGLIFIRSISWPQSANPNDDQGVGPLQAQTIAVRDDGVQARVVKSTGAQYICTQRDAIDGNVYALPMLSINGREFSSIPQVPRQGQPSMRVYGLADQPMAKNHPCDLRADLGIMPAKAVFGFPPADGAPARLVYSDLGNVYVYDRALKTTFRLDHAKDRVLASAFPGLTRDGRVIYAATWHDCPDADAAACPERAGYVVIDPYQATSYRQYWQAKNQTPPKACITAGEVVSQRTAFAHQQGIEP